MHPVLQKLMKPPSSSPVHTSFTLTGRVHSHIAPPSSKAKLSSKWQPKNSTGVATTSVVDVVDDELDDKKRRRRASKMCRGESRSGGIQYESGGGSSCDVDAAE